MHNFAVVLKMRLVFEVCFQNFSLLSEIKGLYVEADYY